MPRGAPAFVHGLGGGDLDAADPGVLAGGELGHLVPALAQEAAAAGRGDDGQRTEQLE